MVREQLEARGITDCGVLAAMGSVPRHLFVQEALRAQAYEDTPLPIGYGQTISQPYIVALMSQLLEARRGMRVLEIGTGSGYQAAVLASMGCVVFTVERLRELYQSTAPLLRQLGLRSIHMAKARRARWACPKPRLLTASLLQRAGPKCLRRWWTSSTRGAFCSSLWAPGPAPNACCACAKRRAA